MLPGSPGSVNVRKPFRVPDDNLTEARAISSKEEIIGTHIQAKEKDVPRQSLGQNLRSQAGAWEREKGPQPYPQKNRRECPFSIVLPVT